ncbi:transcription antitermination regulator [Skermania sp. ID1734]|uniref:transcription antitermination regulator n=1 Tax=Skermania sp. ID1734 TaxID=2597516 RepID=UPI00117DB381|nr:transcription antitermination regulator [Skermania sp. ID1734]TSD93638.1 transcription antitermination regulator [Skermania sp. ID1734]
MTQNTAPVPTRRHTNSAILDSAEEILVALRRYDVEHAFNELVQAAKRHHVAALKLARALVELTENADASDPHASAVAHHEWGPLLKR